MIYKCFDMRIGIQLPRVVILFVLYILVYVWSRGRSPHADTQASSELLAAYTGVTVGENFGIDVCSLRCRVKSAHISQSKPDSDLGLNRFQYESR